MDPTDCAGTLLVVLPELPVGLLTILRQFPDGILNFGLIGLLQLQLGLGLKLGRLQLGVAPLLVDVLLQLLLLQTKYLQLQLRLLQPDLGSSALTRASTNSRMSTSASWNPALTLLILLITVLEQVPYNMGFGCDTGAGFGAVASAATGTARRTE